MVLMNRSLFGIVFFALFAIHTVHGKNPTEPVSLIGLYPTGDSQYVSAISPLVVFEYKSDWVTPTTESLHLHLDRFSLRNWRGEWSLITQSKKVLHLSADFSERIDEPFFLRCMLVYSGNLHKPALDAFYAQHPDAFPVEVSFPNKPLQEQVRPEVLLLPATGVSISRSHPKPSLWGRIFGAKTPKRVEIHSDTPPNVVIILIDTLRPDHTAPGGHPFIMTPNLDVLSSVGVLFSHSYGASSSTRPSVGSIFTGLQPRAHGAVRHATDGCALHFNVPSLAETFQDSGYQTTAISSNAQVSPAFDFDRGFDTFESSVWESQVTPRGIWHLRSMDEPFYLYLHYMGPHQPYEPTPPWKGMYKGQTQISSSYPSATSILNASKSLHDAYAEEITQEDHQIGLILKELARQGVLDRTLIWLVSDHGEEFWEHWWNGHGATLFEESVRTLSILSYPSRLPMGKTISTPITQVDMFPTLTELLQWKPQTYSQGLNLLPLIEDNPTPEILQRPLFLHHGGGIRVSAHPSDKEAVLKDGKKLVQWTEKNRFDYFDLSTDPLEQNPSQSGEDPSAQSLKIMLENHLNECQEIERKVKSLLGNQNPPLTPEEIENLEGFGYGKDTNPDKN